MIKYGDEYTCNHGEPWGHCCTASVDDRSRFAQTLLRRSELASLPPVKPLIEGILSLRAAVVLFGPTGAGKTFVALAWACCIGTGLNWLGHPVTRHKVLYVIGEGANGLDVRISAWEYAWQMKVTDEDVIFSVKPDSLTDRTVWAEITAEAIALGVQVVMLDTFSSLAPDADETKDAPTFTRRLSDLAAAIDGTAMAVHHPGWSDSDRTRGGYQLEANVDEVLKLAGSPASPLIEVTRKKVKEGPAGERFWLRRRPVALGHDSDGKPIGSIVIETASSSEAETPVRDRVLANLADMDDVGATGPQLLAALGMPADKRSTLYKALKGLVDEGSLTKEGSRGRERYRMVTAHE